MSTRHDKFKAYWESIRRPPLEVLVETQENPSWEDCRANPSWFNWSDYRIKGDSQWELRRKWIDSDFTLPLQLFVPADDEGAAGWKDCRTPIIWNSNAFKYREKPKSKSEAIADNIASVGYKIKDEQLQEANNMLDKITDDEGWIPHTPGNPMPCPPETLVEVKLLDGEIQDASRGVPVSSAQFYAWGETLNPKRGIAAWRPATGRLIATIAVDGAISNQALRAEAHKEGLETFRQIGEAGPSLAEQHPLYPILMKAIEQCMHGKGERHGGAKTPFLEQRWHNISKSTGFRSLVFQACKKMEEACGKEDFGAFEREMLGGIVYAGMALLHVELHGYTKETKEGK